MVVLSQEGLDQFSLMKTCMPANSFTEIPVVDLSNPDAKNAIVKACKEFGFFKVVNHPVPLDLIARLQAAATKFFKLPDSKKELASPPDPHGYGSKKIGINGDVGWLEYVLFHCNPQLLSQKSKVIFNEFSEIFRPVVDDYISAVKNMTAEILEVMADGLNIQPRNMLSRLLKDDQSDSFFRLNHYPPCPEMQPLNGRTLVGFGEHTDPQIISVLRSNETSGLQIYLKDETWVPVPPDQNSFFIIVGDSLQVMSNGRFKSIKHRVLTDHLSSRISMIYFGGPPLHEKIAPLPCIMAEGEESLYKEFTWSEYKMSAYKSRLSDYRLGPFEKNKDK